MPELVRITDVSPRDGLQNEPGIIPTADKVRLIELLGATGVDEIEVTSFVSPKWVPQLADAAEVLAALSGSPSQREGAGGMVRSSQPPPAGSGREHPVLSALVPNEHGMRALLEANRRAGRKLISTIALFTAASETFNRKNTNASIDESFSRFEPVLRSAGQEGLAVRLYISCAIACPFEGEISPVRANGVVSRAATLLDSPACWPSDDQPGLAGFEIVLADTIGAGTPGKVQLLLRKVLENPWLQDLGRWQHPMPLGLHLHDTFGRAAECVKTALDMGIRSFDGSAAGLGGCPYASTPGKRAPGNIATETLVRTIHDAGFVTGVDSDRLAEAARFAAEIVGRSRVPPAERLP